MALTPPGKAAIALRLSSARSLDFDALASDLTADAALLQAARARLEADAANASLQVKDEAAISRFLIDSASNLLTLLDSSAPQASAKQVRLAGQLLCQIAQGVRQGDGDGPAFGTSFCTCGVLELAGMVESRVRDLLSENAAIVRRDDPVISYITAITDDHGEVSPFRLNGRANIRRAPREITLILCAKDMTCRDLWHLAYTIHHELICHAFQGANSSAELPNAHPSCHWTEGWMDAVTLDFVNTWIEDAARPDIWLPLKGDDARGAVARFHDERYTNPRRMRGDDVKRRRRGRQALRELARALTQYNLATADEAGSIARRFALLANVHAEANCDRLRELGTKLQNALLGADEKVVVSVAAACLAFTEHRRLDKLEAEVGDLTY